jgi:putative transcriptional regulator
MTLEEARAKVTADQRAEFRRRMAETTEEDIRRQQIEDGEDPDADVNFQPAPAPAAIRQRLGMSQRQFADMLKIPVRTLRNWEQNRFTIEPAVMTLLRIIDREPEAVMRALRKPKVA